ncbi:MAG: bifunctional UDP-N-acetylglucosamine diphosphorylase/glucosamine-1-phosphate N-acetyltransferase GlmU [Nitriliruptoraceae bacterium]
MPSHATRTHVAAIVLAAGRGTRFRSSVPKVLHRAAGRTLLHHVLSAVRALDVGQLVVIVAPDADDVRAEIDAVAGDEVTVVEQPSPRGTGHAVQCALAALAEGVDRVLVVPGDTPLLTTDVLARLVDADGAGGALLTAHVDDPSGYGRVVRDGSFAVRVVEDADASDDEALIEEINAGMYVFDRSRLQAGVADLAGDNAQGELYLTDVVAGQHADGAPMAAVVADAAVVAGVNDRRQLADAAAVLRRRHLDHLMLDGGVTVIDPATTYVDIDVEIGADTVVLPNTILDGGTRIGARVTIGPNSHLTACQVDDDATVHSTRAESAVIGAGANVGPFAHLRRGTRLGPDTKAGAYVETKNVVVGAGSKIPHLSYVGDAVVGSGVNVACGVVTVNYDGQDKHVTTLEDGAFIGCDTMLVAPVTIGANAYTAAGSVITDDVPPGALAIARSRQTIKEGWVDARRT